MTRLSLLPLLLLSAPLCQADPPPTFLSLGFGDEAAVYDLGGEHTFVQKLKNEGGVETDFFFSLPLVHRPDGRIHGSGIVIVGLGDQGFAANFRANGTVYKTSGGLTRMVLEVRMAGRDFIMGVSTEFSVTINYRLSVVPGEALMVGTAKGKGEFDNLGSGYFDSDVEIPLYAAGDGSWGVNQELLTLNKIIGNGVVVLSNGRVLTARSSGVYSPRSDVSWLNVASTGESRGSSFQVKFSTFDGVSEPLAISGRILGQRVYYYYPVFED